VLPLTLSAEATYIAANGDELHSSFEGEGSIDFISGTIAFEGIETFVGEPAGFPRPLARASWKATRLR
jgi:hypothetical protein